MAWNKDPAMVVHEAEPYNAEPPAERMVGAPLTPVELFYSRNHGPVPSISADEWRLRVDGLVERPLTLSLADLRTRFSAHTVTATLQCAGNRRAGLTAVREIPGEDLWREGAISTARWTGVRLVDVLAAAELRSDARFVEFVAPDVSELADPPQAFGASISVQKALAPEVLLAWEMNDEPLPQLHGAPLRVVVPGYIGARSVKWLERITAGTEPSGNYFQRVAYRLLPPDADPADPSGGLQLSSVALTSAILSPLDGARVPRGAVTVCGWALAGDGRTVFRVDVSGDGGRQWIQADLEQPLGPFAWTLWQAVLPPDRVAAGSTEIVARAWDSTGTLQPAAPEHVWNPKGYANNSWPRARVTVGS
jgi:sulfite oxidase